VLDAVTANAIALHFITFMIAPLVLGRMLPSLLGDGSFFFCAV
jgi:hypothetical protein